MTERTYLRRLEKNDVTIMQQMESDPEVMKYTRAGVPQTREQSEIRLENQLARKSALEPFGVWLALKKNDHSLAGWFMLMPDGEEKLELGFMLPRAEWGKGYATEICRELIKSVLSEHPEKKIVAYTVPENRASRNVLVKLGFQQVSEDKDLIYYQLK